MARYVHWQTAVGRGSTPNSTACGELGFNVTDTDAVTCFKCKSTPLFILAALRHREVVEALAFPKEDHPCLSNHHPPSTTALPPQR